MPSVPLHPPRSAAPQDSFYNSASNYPLPQLLHTPSGLAILELQGTINIPSRHEINSDDAGISAPESDDPHFETPIGKLIFPHYSPSDPQDTKWMKKVYLYVGQYQRMTGEVKKLAKPLAVIQRRQKPREGAGMRGETEGQATKYEDAAKDGDELEIVEIIRFKIFFPSRPEPVGTE